MMGTTRHGFSLAELLVALLVFQVGLLGVAGLVLLAQRNLMRAEITVRGVLEAQLAADSVRAAGGDGSGSMDYPWGGISWEPAPGIPEGVRAAAYSDLVQDTVAVVTVWPRVDWPAGRREP
jgi:type II secretory pathway pseudopilin PulG